MLRPVSQAGTHQRQRNADIGLGTLVLSLAALSMGLFAYFRNWRCGSAPPALRQRFGARWTGAEGRSAAGTKARHGIGTRSRAGLPRASRVPDPISVGNRDPARDCALVREDIA